MNFEMRDILIYFAVKYNGDWDCIYSAICRKEPLDKELVIKTRDSINYNTVTMIDTAYPESYKALYKPPFVIFYEGEVFPTESIFNNTVASGKGSVTILRESGEV